MISTAHTLNGVVRRVVRKSDKVLESDRQDWVIFIFSTRLSQILEGEVSRRFGVLPQEPALEDEWRSRRIWKLTSVV